MHVKTHRPVQQKKNFIVHKFKNKKIYNRIVVSLGVVVGTWRNLRGEVGMPKVLVILF